MSTHAVEAGTGLSTRLGARSGQHLRWLVGGFAFAFLVPFILADLVELPRDLYYAVYIVGVATFFGLWVRRRASRSGRWCAAAGCGRSCLASPLLAFSL